MIRLLPFLALVFVHSLYGADATFAPRPNLIVVIADQWRAQSFGYGGCPDVRTPNIDRLAGESVRLAHAISGLPVCSPMRSSLLTGQRPLTHGVFLNDVPLDPKATTLAKVLGAAGYDTAYIGKWHVDGHGRSEFIPPERRQGFDYWKVLECTHNYTDSIFYGDAPEKLKWSGYDAFDQTRDAAEYLRAHRDSPKPFVLFLAWGPPHDPYLTAPEKYRALYSPDRLALRGNVPGKIEPQARKILAGYYAHCTALDECVGTLRQTLSETGLEEKSILLFTADHGDMLGSHGLFKKQKPYDESIRIPMLFHGPRATGLMPRELGAPINSEDIMPTLLGLCGASIPKTVEGLDFSGYLREGEAPGDGAAVVQCVAPFGEWDRRAGGKEYRGIRTARHTYVRDLAGPWLLFDNETDPLQMRNLIGDAASAGLQAELEALLVKKLRERGDEFLPGAGYIQRWGWTVDANGTVPYTP